MPYQMKDGKWRAKRMIDGKVKTKSFATKREAQKWEAEQTAESWQQTPSACFLEIATAYLRFSETRVCDKNMAEKKLALRQLFLWIKPDATPEAITPALALQMLQKIGREKTNNAANKVRKNLAALWEWGKKFHGLPPVNPFREAPKFPHDEDPRYVPPEADFWTVFEVADESQRLMLLVALHTGARRGEIFRLTWEDVDLEGRKIRLGTRKTASHGLRYDWLPLTDVLYDALSAAKGLKQSGYVFTDSRTGEPFVTRKRLMKSLCDKAGVKPFGFHAIRHLSATILAYAGLDIPTVQAILRHQNPNTTARYIASLGIKQDVLSDVFANKKGAKVTAFEPSKKAIGT